MALWYALVPLLYGAAVEARRGGGGGGGGGGRGGSSSSTLNLDPASMAIFVISVLFAICSFVQFVSAVGNFKNRPAEDDYPRRLGAAALLALTTICTTTSWALNAYVISQRSTNATGDFITVGLCSTMNEFLFTLAHILFISTVLVILDWRAHQQAVQYGHTRSRQFATMVRFGIFPFLFVMLVCAAARAGISGGSYTSRISSVDRKIQMDVYDALFHVFRAFFILAVVATVGTNIVLWTNRRPGSSTFEIAQFDDRVLKRVLYFICSVLALQAVYELIWHILIYLRRTVTFRGSGGVTINYMALIIADTVIQGLFFLWMIGFALNLGIRPKKDRQAAQVRAEVKAY